MLPKDPVILLSYVNTKLRDQYSSLEEFCAAEDISVEELKHTLESIGCSYQEEGRCFK